MMFRKKLRVFLPIGNKTTVSNIAIMKIWPRSAATHDNANANANNWRFGSGGADASE